MPKNPKILLSIFLFIFTFALFSCDSASTSDFKPKPSNVKNETKTTESNDSENKIKVKSSEDGRVLVEIAPNGQIDFGGKKLISKRKNAEKVIYSVDGNEIAEVKTKDADGFKVRDLSGKLLWKIKIKDDKIKISDNEENANPFEIKKKEDGAKVVKNETNLGKVKFNPVSQKVKIKDASEKDIFESRTNVQSNAYGVLLLNEIPENERFIIFSELFARN